MSDRVTTASDIDGSRVPLGDVEAATSLPARGDAGGPAELAAWQRLHDVAMRGGDVDGVPDYLDVARQREIAFQELSAAHREIQRLLDRLDGGTGRPARSHGQIRRTRKKLTRRQRFRSANRRLKDGSLKPLAYVRTCLWIIVKSHRLKVTQPAASAPAGPSHGGGGAGRALRGYGFLNELIKAKEYDHAYVWAAALLTGDESNRQLLDLLAKINAKRGNVSSVLSARQRLAALKKGPGTAERMVEGRLRELSGWVPTIPGPPVAVEPRASHVVLHLVKESRPYLSNGFTSRSHHNFVAEKAAGLAPHVVTEPGFPRSSGLTEFPLVEDVDGIPHHRLDLGSAEQADEPVDAFLERFALMAYQKVLEIRPAVIHASSGRRGFETALVGLALKQKTGLPLVYEVRSFFEGNWTGDTAWEETGETYLRRRAIEVMCMERADAVLTLGEAMKDELVKAGIPADKIGLIPNGVDMEDFEASEHEADLRSSLGLADLPTFGYVSNMDHYRESQETLVRACAVLRDRGHDMRCVLVGGGGRTETIKRLAEQLGVADRVVFTGPVDHKDVPSYYGIIDLFVVPRIAERAANYVTPLKPFEAMAMGRPVITSDLPALVEIVDPPNRGLTFRSGDPESLADLLQRCVAEPELVREVSQRGYEWVRGHRQWLHNGPRYKAVFDSLTDGAPSAG